MKHDHDEVPADLSPLADLLDAGGDRFVSMVVARVAAAEAPLPSAVDPLLGLWSMRRGLGLAGAALAVLLLFLRAQTPDMPSAPSTVAESIGVPPEFLVLLAAQSERGH